MSPGTLVFVILISLTFYSIGKWLESDDNNKSDTEIQAKNSVSGVLGILMLAGLFWLLFIPNGICSSACIKDFDLPFGGGRCESSYGDCPEQVWGR